MKRAGGLSRQRGRGSFMRHSLCVAVFAAVSVLSGGSACEPAASPVAPAPRAPRPPRAVAAPPGASPAPARQETASELLAGLPADEQAKRALLERMCTPAIGRYTGEFVPELEGQLVFGCSCCPPFDDCPPSGAAEVTIAEPSNVYPLRHWHEGRFTQAGAPQLAATFMGCEPGAENRGGTLVFNQHGDRLERVVYRSGVNPDSCQVLVEAPRRDRLVCLQSSGMGSTNYTQVLLVDLASEAEADPVTEIARLDDDRACLLEAEPYVSIRVVNVELVDTNADRRLDLAIEVTTRSGVLREADLATCTDETWAPTTLPSPTRERFVYLARGDAFVATTETTKRLEALYRTRNAHRGP